MRTDGRLIHTHKPRQAQSEDNGEEGMAATDALEQAIASTRPVLANVKDDQLSDPTPCQSWDVRKLINHLIWGPNWCAVTTERGAAPEVDDMASIDYAAGDRMQAFDEGVRKAVAAFNAPGAQEKVIKLPFGEMPGAFFMGIATTDVFIHGWDLARATGQDAANLNPALAEQLLAGARAAISDQWRGQDGVAPFGPEVKVPDSAPAADRLAGFLGRRV
jgi:uncharacterized protein (TIGR03086 family)